MGVQVACDATALSGVEPCSGQMYIGSNKFGTGNYWSGGIDDVRIYQRALTTKEVNELVN